MFQVDIVRESNYGIEEAKKEAQCHKLFVSLYEDNQEIFIELEGDLCYVYNLDNNTWRKSSFMTTEDFEEIQSEIEAQKMLNFKYRRIKQVSNNTITVMCDYYAYPLWFGDNLLKEPNNYKLIKHRLVRWQKKYKSFKFYKTNNFQQKVISKSLKYKIWLTEGYKIAVWIRKYSHSYINVQYFNESTLDRKILLKRNT